MFEMRNIDDVPHIEIFIKNSSSSTAIPIDIPNCGLSCPLAKFYVLYKDVLPTESFEDECIVKQRKHSGSDKNGEHLLLKINISDRVNFFHAHYFNSIIIFSSYCSNKLLVSKPSAKKYISLHFSPFIVLNFYDPDISTVVREH